MKNQRRGGFCYYHYTTFIETVKIPFRKKEYKLPLFLTLHTCYTQCNRYAVYCQLSINQFMQHNFFCTIVDAAHSLNPFPLIIFFHFLSYRLSFLHLTDNDLQSFLCLVVYICKVSPELATQHQIIKQYRFRHLPWQMNNTFIISLYPLICLFFLVIKGFYKTNV